MQVSALCAVLDKDLSERHRTTEVDIDALLATSYTSLFKQEVERRLKQVGMKRVWVVVLVDSPRDVPLGRVRPTSPILARGSTSTLRVCESPCFPDGTITVC